MDPIFTGWREQDTQLWGNQPLCLQHRLHEHPLFSMENLARLIEAYPHGTARGNGRPDFMLVAVGGRGQEKEWREGDFAGLNGLQVIEAVQAGRMWLNLLHVHEVDRRYGELLDQICEEMQAHMPWCRTFNRVSGILISSPEAQVYYHFDTSGQGLWQIVGRKRVYVYPAVPPFLKREELESVCFHHHETSISYEPWYDHHAAVFEIGPGQMLSWPLNAPHRIENLGYSVSMTFEYQTEAIRRNVFVNATNCVLREKFGLHPQNQLVGPSYYAKLALYAAMKKSGYLEQKRRARRPITFHLDPAVPGRRIEAASA